MCVTCGRVAGGPPAPPRYHSPPARPAPALRSYGHRAVTLGSFTPLRCRAALPRRPGAPASQPSPPTPPPARGRVASAGNRPPPSLADAPTPSTSGRPATPTPPPPPSPLSRVGKAALRRLSSLPLAIGVLAALAGESAVGTLIEQGKGPDYYADAYPAGMGGLAGIVNYRTITTLGWDHVYSSPAFLGLATLLAACLAACTTTRQWPAARVARSWRFAGSPSAVYAHARGAKGMGAAGSAARLPGGRAADLGKVLAARGYQVFVRREERGAASGRGGVDGAASASDPSAAAGAALYAFKGMAGKLGPIAVHASLLLILFGTAYGALAGLRGNALVPVGGEFVLRDALAPASPLARPPASAAAAVRVDGFDVQYRDDGSVAQFVSDLTVLDPGSGRVLAAKRISVNEPLRFQGVTLYQADYAMAAITLTADGSPLSPPGGGSFNLPVAALDGAAGVKGKAWATFVPSPDGAGPPRAPGAPPRGVTLLARDFQSIVLYKADGSFAGVRRPGSGNPIVVDGLTITIDDVVGSTGLDVKADPGVPAVYAGFGGLMVSTLVSYLSFNQVWALEEGGALHVAGRTNRAALAFGGELDAALLEVPEREEGDGGGGGGGEGGATGGA